MNRREKALNIFLHLKTGQSLAQILEQSQLNQQDEAWIIALVEGSCRRYFQLRTFLNACLLKQTLPEKDRDVESLLVLALYELIFMKSPVYATVNEWVKITSLIKKKSYSGLVNAVCRRYSREKSTLHYENFPNAPSWLIKKYRHHFSDKQATEILAAQDQKPPLFLRVNLKKISLDHFFNLLTLAGHEATLKPELDQCIMLAQTCHISELPGYQEGWFYVQDYSAQFAASLLDCQQGHQVLDMCAAPGGKALHLLEKQPEINLTAADTSSARLDILKTNARRLGVSSIVFLEQDMTQAPSKQDQEQFDRILLDAPCSGTGIIRRHPEIKVVKNSAEIAELAQTQQQLLKTAWLLLKPGGMLLYVTCSLLPEENENQILNFLSSHPNAEAISFSLPSGIPQQVGWQLLPRAQGGDGFYYAKLLKSRH